MNRRQTSTAEHFETHDYWLAGALVASGNRLIGLRWIGSRAIFLLLPAPDCEAASQAYWMGDLEVSAKAYSDALRGLKDRLYCEVRSKDHP